MSVETTPSRASDLRAELGAHLSALIPRGERVALVDFPNHPNVGDSAIWLGELAALEQLGARVVYGCETVGFAEAPLRRALRHGGTILIHGGGNLGDLWPDHQQLRERVIASFPDHPIVQLPQSIHFSSERNLSRVRALFASHPRLTVLCRDRQSLDLASGGLGARAELCPDGALGLSVSRPKAQPSVPVLWLARTDAERNGPRVDPAGAPGVRVVDWLSERRGDEGWTAAYGLARSLTAHLGSRLTQRSAVAGAASPRLHRALARSRVKFGVRLLASAEVVVTDRLHGHILCLMLGIPHVVVDNGYGKIRAFISTWEQPSAEVRLAEDAEHALAEARRLLEEVRGRDAAAEGSPSPTAAGLAPPAR